MSEDFIGLHPLETANSDSITQIIKDVLLRLDLSIHDCRGQCYDGPKVMTGHIKGVATQIKCENPM